MAFRNFRTISINQWRQNVHHNASPALENVFIYLSETMRPSIIVKSSAKKTRPLRDSDPEKIGEKAGKGPRQIKAKARDNFCPDGHKSRWSGYSKGGARILDICRARGEFFRFSICGSVYLFVYIYNIRRCDCVYSVLGREVVVCF